LDRSERDDPRWLLATVASGADVRAASPGDDRPDEVTRAWAAGGGTLTPLHVLAWLIDGRR
jgi:hypothetical protein